MSVHTPHSSMTMPAPLGVLACRAARCASAVEPNVGFSMRGISGVRASAISGSSAQPGVPLTQWTTGR